MTTATPRRPRVSLLFALLSTLVASTLAGCAGSPQAAAVVDGHVVPQAEVARTFEQIGPFLPDSSPTAVVQFLVLAPTVIDAAEANGVAVSTQDATDLLDQVAEDSGLGTDIAWTSGSIEVAQASLARDALMNLDDASGLSLDAQFAALDVTINPQYGQWSGNSESGADPVAVGIVPIDYPWIAAPASAPAIEVAGS